MLYYASLSRDTVVHDNVAPKAAQLNSGVVLSTLDSSEYACYSSHTDDRPVESGYPPDSPLAFVSSAPYQLTCATCDVLPPHGNAHR